MYYHNVGLKDGFAQEEEVQRCLRKWFVFEKKKLIYRGFFVRRY